MPTRIKTAPNRPNRGMRLPDSVGAVGGGALRLTWAPKSRVEVSPACSLMVRLVEVVGL